jgi:hypothetical protein
MGKPLFDPDLSYPSDDVGKYLEVEGIVRSVEEWDVGHVHADVDTELGLVRAYGDLKPLVGSIATVRIYDSGGGWYPDDRLMGWKAPDGTMGDVPFSHEPSEPAYDPDWDPPIPRGALIAALAISLGLTAMTAMAIFFTARKLGTWLR